MPLEITAYHQRTKHHFQRFAAGPHGLDWATQPHPFRRWMGAELVPLPFVPPASGPSYLEALETEAVVPAPLTNDSIAQLCYDSLALSAWKQAGGSQWPLRVNPSSGNLHPTEGYLLLPPVPGLGDEAAVYHYAPLEHGLERRAVMPTALWERVARELPPGAILCGLTSIHWREAWKYGERAYRYCQHDVGHAIAALSFAAAGLGWRVELMDAVSSEDVASLLGIFAETGPEAEHPDCLAVVRPAGGTGACGPLPSAVGHAFRGLDWRGKANQLSPDHVDWSIIDDAAAATSKPPAPASPSPWRAPGAAPPPAAGGPALRPILHQRRSGVDFDGKTGMAAETFHRILESVMPRSGRRPWEAFPWRPRIDLALFVHRVDGYAPGLYWLSRDPDRLALARASLRADFRWSTPPGCPADLPLHLLRAADLRGTAMDVSCQQSIAGDGAFSLGMIAEFAGSLREHGAWFYPRLFWEAGAIGQRLYTESEAVGLRSTGIGCFFDDAVHEVLGLRDATFQSLYHFTMGRPVDDLRIMVLPPYSHLRDDPRHAAR